MSEHSRAVPLRRLTRAGRPAPDHGEVSPAKALRLALAKAGQTVLRQLVDGSGIEERVLPLSELPSALPEGGLYVLLDGPSEARGVICLERPVVGAITEGLTMGRISDVDTPERAPTPTDALLCQRFLVTLLTVFAARLVGHAAADWATGFVPEDPVDDLRRLPVLLEDELYRMLSVTTDFAGGRRTGQIALVLPVAGRQGKSGSQKAGTPEPQAGEDWTRALQDAVMPAEVAIEAVLYRVRLPLSEINRLAPGSSISIPLKTIAQVSLEGSNGQCICTGRLGQSQGMRAVRVEPLPAQKGKAPDSEPGSTDSRATSALPSFTDAVAAAPGLAAPCGGETGQERSIKGAEAAKTRGADPDQEKDDVVQMEPNAAGSDTPEAVPSDDPVPMDLGALPMTDLDDLPMSID